MAPNPIAEPLLGGGLNTDIVIPVMGPTKAGRSSFLNRLVGEDIFQVGRKLASCTANVSSHILAKAPIECVELNKVLNGRRMVLVDTPGFDYTRLEDEEILRRISAWLESSYRKGMRVTGVLFLHDISRDDFSRTSHVGLNTFSRLCGDRAMERVAFVTTKWDRLKDSCEGLKRAEDLKQDFWRNELLHGASVLHLQPEGRAVISPEHRAPWDIIHQLVATSSHEGKTLQVQDELVNVGLSLHETAAGRVLRAPLDSLRKAAQRLMRLEREMNAPTPTKEVEDAVKFTRSLEAKSISAFQGRPSDIVLFVVGGIGVGKSTFINYALSGCRHADGTRLKVGDHESINPCTLAIEPVRMQPCSTKSNMGRVVLVDGPGLDDQLSLKGKKALVTETRNWLSRHYPPEKSPQRGIIYVIDVAQDMSELVEFLNLQAAIYLSTTIQSGDILLVAMKCRKPHPTSWDQDRDAEGMLRKQILVRSVIQAGYQMQRIEQGREERTTLHAVQYFLEGTDTQRAESVARRHSRLIDIQSLQKWKAK